jgi:hypothetical protein
MPYVTPTARGDGYVVPASEWNQNVVTNPIAWEVGTWTPTIGGSGGQSGQVHAVQTGNYIKIGQLVFVTFQLQMTTLGTVTTIAQVQGLPFAGIVANQAIGELFFSALTTSVSSFTGYVGAGSTSLNLVYVPAAGSTGVSNAAQADLSNTTTITGSFSYMAAS